MKIRNRKVILLISSLFAISILAVGCSNEKNTQGEVKTKQQTNIETTKNDFTYDNNDYFTDINWLEKNLNNKDIVIIDARSEKDYSKGHIPGAINVAWQSFCNMEGKGGDKGWGTLLDKEQLSKIYSDLGIGKNKKVVVYATKDGWGEDGRLVWMFKETGVDARMLNGGIDLWKSEGKEISKEKVDPKKSEFVVEELKNDMNIDTENLKDNMGKVKIIDTREIDEYDGATKYGEVRGGHLPKSINIPFNKVYNEDGTIKPKVELEKLFKDAGLNKDDEIVTYCTAGIRSGHMALVLKSLGYENVKNYDASYQEWAGDKTNPIEK
ncbi:MAG: sulfurtransferase [Romboutsia sp.]